MHDLNKVEEKKIIKEELIPLLSFKKKNIGVCTAFIVFESSDLC